MSRVVVVVCHHLGGYANNRTLLANRTLKMLPLFGSLLFHTFCLPTLRRSFVNVRSAFHATRPAYNAVLVWLRLKFSTGFRQ